MHIPQIPNQLSFVPRQLSQPVVDRNMDACKRVFSSCRQDKETHTPKRVIPVDDFQQTNKRKRKRERETLWKEVHRQIRLGVWACTRTPSLFSISVQIELTVVMLQTSDISNLWPYPLPTKVPYPTGAAERGTTREAKTFARSYHTFLRWSFPTH